MQTTARLRLLDAAARVFSRRGFDSATTREIAQDAQVNEVTLFRHFASKANLQQAVLDRLADQIAATPTAAGSDNINAELARFVSDYRRLINDHLPMIRALLGSDSASEAQVRALRSIYYPLRAQLVEILEKAKRKGGLRRGINPALVVDLLAGMIFMDALKRGNGKVCPPYSETEHSAAAIDIFLKGILK